MATWEVVTIQLAARAPATTRRLHGSSNDNTTGSLSKRVLRVMRYLDDEVSGIERRVQHQVVGHFRHRPGTGERQHVAVLRTRAHSQHTAGVMRHSPHT